MARPSTPSLALLRGPALPNRLIASLPGELPKRFLSTRAFLASLSSN